MKHFNGTQIDGAIVQEKKEKEQKTGKVNSNLIWTSERMNAVRQSLTRGEIVEGPNPFFEKNFDLMKDNLIFERTEDEINEYIKCSEDIIYFAEKYCRIKNKMGQYTNFKLRPYQKKALKHYQENRFTVYAASRQIGKSVMTGIFINWYIIFNTEKNILVMANKGDTMEEIIDKILRIHESLPYFLKPGVFKKNMSELRFDNDCKVFGQCTTASAAIGFAVDFLFADEFAKIPDNIAEEFYASIYPTLSSMDNSRMVITSTAHGLNLFYRLYTNAVQGKGRFKPLITYWWEVEGHDEAWKQETIADLGGDEDRFNREFGVQFLTPGKLLLDAETLQRLQEETTKYVHYEIDKLEDDDVEYKALLWDENEFEKIEEDKKKKQFIIAVDLAEGVGLDYSVLNIFEVRCIDSSLFGSLKFVESENDFVYFKQIGIYRTNDVDIHGVAKIAIGIINFLGPENTRINLEYNKDGGWFHDIIKKTYDEYYDELFLKTHHTVDAKKRNVGVKVTGANKTNFCTSLKRRIRNKQVVFNEENTINEMLSFGLDKNGSYNSQSGHDDIAMTLVGLSACYDSYEFHEVVAEVLENMKPEDSVKMYDIISENIDGGDSISYYGGKEKVNEETIVVSKRIY